MSVWTRLRLHFTENFESDTFAYVLYPFLCIFQIFGFAPIKLKNGDILRNRALNGQIEFSFSNWVFSISDFVLYIVGFIFGVHHLSETHNWLRLHDDTIIVFYTSWVQIVAIFVLGAVTIITSWTHLDDMKCFCKAIFRIDDLLNTVEGIKIDYKSFRRRLFIRFVVGFMVPASLSMVNCITIQPAPFQFVLSTSCFWFICFAPIMLLNFKEFQFYNLMYLLKLKFDLVNEKLKAFGSGGRTRSHQRRRQYARIGTVNSVSEIPLTSMPSMEPMEPARHHNSLVDVVGMYEEKGTIEALQKLLKVYTMIADATELLLKIFSWHLVLLTAVSIAVIIIQCYNIFAFLVNALQMQPYQVCFVIAWIFVQVAIIGVNVSVCSLTSKSMSLTGPLLHKIQAQAVGTERECLFYQMVQIFSLEVLQRKEAFTAAGFFDIDFKLITSIIASVTTYLVIIIQFHLNNIPIAKNIHVNQTVG